MVRLIFIAYFGDAEADLFITFSVGKILTMYVWISYICFTMLNWTLESCSICRLLEFFRFIFWVHISVGFIFIWVTLIGKFWGFWKLIPLHIILPILNDVLIVVLSYSLCTFKFWFFLKNLSYYSLLELVLLWQNLYLCSISPIALLDYIYDNITLKSITYSLYLAKGPKSL